MIKTNKAITGQLVRFYVARGMTERLADAVIVCRWVETLLEDLKPHETARLRPVFDYPIEQLRDDWLKCLYFDLWLDENTGTVVDSLPPADGDINIDHTPLPVELQREILFGRFSHLFCS